MKVRVTLMAQQTVELDLDRPFDDTADTLTEKEREEAHQRVIRTDPPWRIVDVYTPEETE